MHLFGFSKSSNKEQTEKKLFDCKFGSKQLCREGNKYAKQAKQSKKKCRKAMEKGNTDQAKVYADNSIQQQIKSDKYLKTSARVDVFINKINTAIKMDKFTKSMSKYLDNIQSVLKTLDVDKIIAELDKLATQFEELDIGSQFMESSLDCSTMTTMPNSTVQDLMCQIADEQGLAAQFSNTIGLSVGGAKDINQFRKCIQQNIMPSIASITFNGLFYDYYFDTSTRQTIYNNDNNDNDNDDDDKNDSSHLFYPTYCFAKTKDLYSSNEEYYMSLGLNSNISQNSFKRKHLNLIIVLDNSGSMSLPFDDNYNTNQSKMKVANESVCELLKYLTIKDRFSLVTFESNAKIIQTMKFVNNIDLNHLKSKILNIKHAGGTNFEAGYSKAIEIFDALFKDNDYSLNSSVNNQYENRIIFLTDAKPNISIIDPTSLLSMVSKYADNIINNNRIYTTFIGIGLDFNADLIQIISHTRGCNYYSVKSIKEFMKRMGNEKEFENMVTPLVFNVCLKFKAEGNSCEIIKVYGSSNNQSNIITKINTLFPSTKRNGKTKGGIQIIKLKKNVNNNNNNNNIDGINIEIEVSFEDRNGKKYVNKQIVTFKPMAAMSNIILNDMIDDDNDNDNVSDDFYDNLGIRKGVLLCKYGELIMQWINDGTVNNSNNNSIQVNDEYKNKFLILLKHFTKEMQLCNDNDLQKELDIIKKLINLDLTTTFADNDVASFSNSNSSLEERLRKLQGI